MKRRKRMLLVNIKTSVQVVVIATVQMLSGFAAMSVIAVTMEDA